MHTPELGIIEAGLIAPPSTPTVCRHVLPNLVTYFDHLKPTTEARGGSIKRLFNSDSRKSTLPDKVQGMFALVT